MKGTEAFTRIIQNYLNDEAIKDETIKAKLAMPKNCIENVVSYIINQVKNSGCCGITSSEIYSLALHFVLEDDLEPGTRLPHQRQHRGRVATVFHVMPSFWEGL
jgi:hypothetical protein